MTSSRTLQRFARRAAEESRSAAEKCDLCDEVVPVEHRHLLQSDERSVACVCQVCALLFARPEASLGKYRLIPDRYLYLADFTLTDAEWNALYIPVGMCFISAGRATYPGSLGPVDAFISAEVWSTLTARCRLLGELEPEVEALLINRTRGASDYFVVPIDTCFRLVGLVRTRWRGLTGGTELWQQLATFFEALRRRSRVYHAPVEEGRCLSVTT